MACSCAQLDHERVDFLAVVMINFEGIGCTASMKRCSNTPGLRFILARFYIVSQPSRHVEVSLTGYCYADISFYVTLCFEDVNVAIKDGALPYLCFKLCA